LFRHYFAHQWLSSGSQETGLVRPGRVAVTLDVGRYAESAADERDRDVHRRMGLDDKI
jgi:hypothetical protein